MFVVLAELFSTIGMVLLAGEYVQGKSGWFNRILERYILRLFSQRLFLKFLSRQQQQQPLMVARGLLRRQWRYVALSILGPVLFLLWCSLVIEDQTDLAAPDRAIFAIYNGDPSAQELARKVLGDYATVMSDCIAITKAPDIAKALKDKTPNPAGSKALSDCLSKLPQFDYYVPLGHRLWFLFRYQPTQLIIPLVLMCASVFVILYFLSIGLSLSRFYTRIFRIESFILPVGFIFTAVGQMIKLGITLFS